MKKVICVLAILFGFCSHTNSTNYNGTTGVIFVSYDQPFSNAATHTMTGFVRFEKGCTVLNYSSSTAEIVWDACMPFAGGLDLRDTNSLALLRDFNCQSNFTFSSGGNVYGNGNAIILSGNLTIPDGKIIHIGNNTIIDGRGHELTVGSWSQIFVDMNKTLTLKNLILKNGNHPLSFPPVLLASLNSKLALSNVEMAATGDFLFPQGQLFIHDDVAFTGTNAFVYWSTQQSFIDKNSTFYFDIGTTFSVAPTTFTSDSFDKTRTNTSNNFINFIDSSSTLYLNNCSFKTTMTGCRLQVGNVIFDNKVSMYTRESSDVSSNILNLIDSISTFPNPVRVSISPNGAFIAVCQPSAGLKIHTFSGAEKLGLADTWSFTTSVLDSISWSPDGKFILGIGSSTSKIYVFSISNSGIKQNWWTATASGSAIINGCWSPDGRFIAVACHGSSTLEIYSFSGTSTPTFVTSINTATNGGLPWAIAWASNGKFIAVTGANNNTLQIYSFSSSMLLTKVSFISITGITPSPRAVSWSSDGGFIAVSNFTSQTVQIFRFFGSGVPVFLGSVSPGAGSQCANVWSREFLICCGVTGLNIYKLDFTNNITSVGSISYVGLSYSVSMSNDFKYVCTAFGGNLYVYKINYINDIGEQALSNSFVFGNSALGSGYDANINLLSAANLDLNTGCKVLINNVNN